MRKSTQKDTTQVTSVVVESKEIEATKIKNKENSSVKNAVETTVAAAAVVTPAATATTAPANVPSKRKLNTGTTQQNAVPVNVNGGAKKEQKVTQAQVASEEVTVVNKKAKTSEPVAPQYLRSDSEFEVIGF